MYLSLFHLSIWAYLSHSCSILIILVSTFISFSLPSLSLIRKKWQVCWFDLYLFIMFYFMFKCNNSYRNTDFKWIFRRKGLFHVYENWFLQGRGAIKRIYFLLNTSQSPFNYFHHAIRPMYDFDQESKKLFKIMRIYT